MLVLGVLMGTFIGLIFMIRIIFIDAAGQVSLDDAQALAAIDQRLAPAGSAILMGSDELAAAAAAPLVMPEPDATPLTGQQVYNQACIACHSPPDGVGGAPVIGDAAAWEGRAAQGRETLIDHALNGYQGDAGFMPAKGGRVDLSDDEVIAAIEYMLEQLGE